MYIQKSTRDYLSFYFNTYGPFAVREACGAGYPWVTYGTGQYDVLFSRKVPKHRIVFPDEIIIELDHPERKWNDYYAELIMKRLRRMKFSYSHFTSGGKSNHIHMFFPQIRRMEVHQRLLFKKLLIFFICAGLMQKAEVDNNMFMKTRQMIRMELTEREDGKGQKLLLGYKNYGENEIPKFIFKEIENQKRIEKERREKWKKEADVKKGTPWPLEEKCIKYILSETFAHTRDGRKNALFILASYYLKKGLQPVEAYCKVKRWNDYNLNRYFTDNQIRYQVQRKPYRLGLRTYESFLYQMGILNDFTSE